MNNDPTQVNQIELSPEKLQHVKEEMGRVVVFRVMNLEGHSGVQSQDDEGRTTYTVDNLQYEDQGDFAFGGDNGFDAAVTRAFPNHLRQVHAIRAGAEDIIEPYPEEAPGLVYVKNGATVEAVRVPEELIDRHIDSVHSAKELESTRDIIGQIFKD